MRFDIMKKLMQGYQQFKNKYNGDSNPLMKTLAQQGQTPELMIISCCDARVEPSIIFQCDPGDLFVVRNVGALVPPYENDGMHHSTSAALEFGIRFLKVKHLVLLGHSQCGGMQMLLDNTNTDNKSEHKTDFLLDWVSSVKLHDFQHDDVDNCVKHSLLQSYQNCLTFPWIKSQLAQKELEIYICFFNIENAEISMYNGDSYQYPQF